MLCIFRFRSAYLDHARHRINEQIESCTRINLDSSWEIACAADNAVAAHIGG